jgi:hypothetical protein
MVVLAVVVLHLLAVVVVQVELVLVDKVLQVVQVQII